MIRTLSILATLPCLAGCGLEELFSPGSSQARYEYQQAGLIQPPAAPITPQPTQVAEIPFPATVGVPEPVYVAPEPTAPYVPPPTTKPVCVPVHMIVACDSDGNTVLLEW